MRVAILGDFERHCEMMERALLEVYRQGMKFVPLSRIGHAHFAWLVAPDGLVSVPTAMDIGLAHGGSVPIFTPHFVADQTLRHYAYRVPDLVTVCDVLLDARRERHQHDREARRLLVLEHPDLRFTFSSR